MTTDASWKNDPRVRSMDPEKIRFLEEFAGQIQHTPGPQLINRFLSVNGEAQKRGISFSDRETGLLTDILLEHMPPKDRQKLELLRMLSQRIGGQK